MGESRTPKQTVLSGSGIPSSLHHGMEPKPRFALGLKVYETFVPLSTLHGHNYTTSYDIDVVSLSKIHHIFEYYLEYLLFHDGILYDN